MTETATGLQVAGLTHIYPNRRNKPANAPVLEDIWLSIPANAFVSVIGASGCGKSTLIKIMAGLETPTEGQVFLDGEAISKPTNRIGMVFQQDAVFPWMNVMNNIAFGMKVQGVPRQERLARATEWAGRVGLTGRESALPKELSGGMRKRVDLARVYANDPEVLLMDEPFGALDAQTKERMQHDLLVLWEAQRKTVVFVTHDIDEAIFLSDYVVVMSARPGRIANVEPIALPRQRTDDMRLSPEFQEYKKKFRDRIEELSSPIAANS